MTLSKNTGLVFIAMILSASAQARTLSISLVENEQTIERKTVAIGDDHQKTIRLNSGAVCKASTVTGSEVVGIVEIYSADGVRSVAIGGKATVGLLDTTVNGRTQTINCAITK